VIHNQSRGTVLAADVRWAVTPWLRFLGLMGRHALPPGVALVFPGEKGIHTHFMRFPIDVIFYDRERVVVEVAHAIRPWRFSAYKFGAAGVIELPAGTVRQTDTHVGDQLSITE
jgi:uncharacterized membrane protein (UPF0127 family)